MGRKSRSQSRTSLRSSNSVENGSELEEEENDQAPEQPQQLEASSKGKVSGSIFGMYLTSGANWCVLLIIGALFLITQVLASGADYWVSYWTSQEELRQFYATQANPAADRIMLVNDQYMAEFMPTLNHTQLTNATKAQLMDARQEAGTLDGLYGLLSTEMCMYIHGGLIAGLFVFGLTRCVLDLCFLGSILF